MADFLAALRRRLGATKEWRDLVAYTDREEIRDWLRQMGADLARTAAATERTADATERMGLYLEALLADRGLKPDKPDAAYLKEYVEQILELHSRISFLFIRPAGRPGRRGRRTDRRQHKPPGGTVPHPRLFHARASRGRDQRPQPSRRLL